MGVFVMPGIERRPVLRGFQEPDHENGVDLKYDPAGNPDADPTKEPSSVYKGPVAHRWYLEDDPDFEFTNSDGLVVKRLLRVGGDGAGPLLGPPLGEPVEPPPESANKQPWVDWAISQGADPDEANATTKPDLIAQYGAGTDTQES
jgi:hypothetical protein